MTVKNELGRRLVDFVKDRQDRAAGIPENRVHLVLRQQTLPVMFHTDNVAVIVAELFAVHVTAAVDVDLGRIHHVEQVVTPLVVGEDGTAVYELGGLTPGVYRIEGRATVAGRQQDASDIFLVREGGNELDKPVGDPGILETISQGTGGKALGPVASLPRDLAFDAPRIVRVDRRTDVELWSRPGLLLLVVGLLGLEWLLRQRNGYL